MKDAFEDSTPRSPIQWLRGVLWVAISYLLAGRLGLLLAIPPGFATAIWPPTGIALAGLIILGPRAMWGVWLGSFAVNLWVSFSSGQLSWATGAMACSIAVGAAIGARIALFVLYRRGGWSPALEHQGDILRFMFLGIPVMALWTATWGVGSLVAFGVAPVSGSAVNWLTWWCGDVLGAMVFAPLGLVFFGKPKSLWIQRRLTVGVPLLAAFSLAATFFVLVRKWEGDRTQHQQMAVVIGVETQMRDRLRANAMMMESAAAFFEGSPKVGPGEFNAYVNAIFGNNPGMVALEWAPFVAASEQESMQVWAANYIHQPFRVHPFATGSVPARVRVPALLIYPREGNERAVGLDLNSEPQRGHGVEAAVREGRPVSTRCIRLIQGPMGFLLFRVSRGPLLQDAKAPGVLVGVFDAVGWLNQGQVPSGMNIEGTRISLWDGAGPSATLLCAMEAKKGLWHPAEALGKGAYSRWVELGGVQWRMEITPQGEPDRIWVLWFVLSGGALFTGLVGSILLLVTGRTKLVEEMVRERTQQLHQGEDRLRRQGRLLERTQKAAGVAGWELTPSTGDMVWTQESASLFHLPRQTVPDLRTALSLLQPQYLDPVRNALERASRDGTAFDLEVEVNLPSGQHRWVRLTGSAVVDDGKVTGLYGSAQDISTFKEAVQAKDAFVSVVSHELRTPLTSIRGSLGLLLAGVAGELKDKAKELVELASANCERQIRLVNDLLDMERLGAGKVELREETFAIGALIDQAAHEHAGYAQMNGVRIQVHSSPEAIRVAGDPARVHQVVSNLLSNACKFSPEGGAVHVSLLKKSTRARVEVRDDGPGIPEAFRDRIFQPFAQADSSDTRAKGGTGLGLAIAKALVARMGGLMGFEVPESGGTVFWFELPLA